MIRKQIMLVVLQCVLFINLASAQNHNPAIDTVRVSQRLGTFLVDIYYTVSDQDNDALTVYMFVSSDSGKTFTVPAKSFEGDYGVGILPGANKHIVWNAGADFPEQYGEKFRVKLTASDLQLGQMTSIQSGTFSMGDSTGLDDQQPRHNVILNEYGISRYSVTNAEYRIFCDMTRRAYPP